MMETIPTHSLEMEMSVLGSVMLDTKAFREVSSLLKPESFWRPSHKAIFRAATDLYRQGKPTNCEFVIQRLQDTNQLDDIGGADYVIQVAEYVPSPSQALHYAGIVAEKAEIRAYEQLAKTLISSIKEGKELDEIRLLAASVSKANRASAAFVDISEVDASGEDKGISTGVVGIDNAISTKGYPKGQVSVVSAYHKAGKSTFMVQSYVHQCSEGFRCLYATFADLNAKRLKRRMLRAISGWSRMPDDMFDQMDFEAAVKQINTLWEGSIYDASKADLESIENFLAQLETQHLDRPYDCVFIDYAQKLVSANKRASMGGVAEQDWISHVIARTAERLDLAIVVGSQITEGGKDSRTITKGSRKWEEDAGLVIRIKREGLEAMEWEIPYSRFGGGGTVVTGYWDPKRLIFKEAVR